MQVTWNAVRVLVSATTALALVAAVGIYTVVTKAVDISQLERLERRNAALESELSHIRVAVDHLADTVSVIAELDREVRLLAGLEPNDPEVQQAGVGGPAGPMSTADRLLSETTLGREAVTARADLSALNRRAQFLLSSFDQALDTMSAEQERLARTPSIMPTAGFISSGFSMARMHPVHHEVLPHLGVDVPAPRGTPILAPAKGRVVEVGTQVGYGKIVTIDHGNGVQTRYAHCSEVLVRAGQRLERGDQIALVGKTGVATNYHLHYEVLVNGRQVDPRQFMFGAVIVD